MLSPRTPTLIGAALLSCALLAGCAGSKTAGAPTGPRLGMVTDVGGLGDRSFNDSAYAGLKAAQKLLHAQIQVVSSRSASDYQPNLLLLATKEYQEVFAIGFLMAKDLSEVAASHPKTHFAIIDAVVDLPNVASVTFKEEEGSFLAGAAAALVTKTKTVAFLGGIDIPLLRKFEAGFTAGVHQIDPRVNVLVKYTGSFDDVAAGKELGGVLFDQGADIVFVAAGKAGLGAIEQVKSRPNHFVIGVDSNQDAIAPGKILTSMIKRVDVGVLRVSEQAASEKPASGHVILGLKDDGVGLTDFKYTKSAMTPAKFKQLDTIKAAIISGKIVPPATREELATFKRVAL